MSTRGIAWQTIQIPFNAGLYQKSDDRARRAPFLNICRDVQFDEIGGLQVRYPYATAEGDIHGGGTIANARRIVRYGNERVLFTKDTVYSWNAQLEKWVSRGTHLAVKIDEDPRFATTGDQIDADRAQIDDVALYAWVEGSTVYYAVLNVSTDSVIVPPTSLAGAVAGSRPRAIALNGVFLLFRYFATPSELHVSDVSASTGALGGTAVLTSVNSFYDVVKVEGQDLAIGAYRRSTTTSYTVFTINSALTVTAVTKARTCDGPIAVAATPDGQSALVVRQNTAVAVQSDLLVLSTLADNTVNQTIINGAASAARHIAVAYSSTATSPGVYRAYIFAFGESEPSTNGTGVVLMNHITTAGTVGSSTTFARQLGIASRAFDHDGRVYVWLAFGGQSTVATTGPFTGPGFALQNTYFLYRDDAFLVAKCVAAHGGGLQPTQGLLPGVQLVDGTTGYAWCATLRRKLNLGTRGVGFAARTPVDVSFTFDSDEARRTARIGATLYITGGEILQYDGVRIVEVGHHIYPWFIGIIDAGGASVATGVYSYKQTYRYQNGQGETDRSTTATIVSINNTGSSLSIISSTPLTVTHKTANPPAAEFWRTRVAPVFDSPFYLVSGQDPTDLTNPNRYVANDTTLTSLPTFNDFLVDADAAKLETNPENGAVLENIAPPPAGIILATDTRLFLADVAGDPDRVWYSRLRGTNEVAGFSDFLTFNVPRVGGRITSLRFLEQTLYVFRETAVYAFAGVGFDNLRQGQNFTLVREVSLDLGAVSDEAVAVTPPGVLFKSRKGWQLLRGNGSIEYVGDRASDFDDEEPLAIDVVETQHQVRILTAERMIVWDYNVNQWFEWTVSSGVHACMSDGAHVVLVDGGTRTQQTTYTGLTYGYDIEMTVHPAGIAADVQNNAGPGSQAASRVRRLQPFGEIRSAHLMRARIAYNNNPSYVDDVLRSVAESPGSPLQVIIGPRQPQCTSVRLRLTAVTSAVLATRTTATFVDPVLTSVSPWAATFRAVPLGELGNAVFLRLAFVVGSGSIDVRDHFAYDTSSGTWAPAVNTIGVLVTGAPTVAQLEAAIVAGTALATLTVADAAPSKVVNVAANVGRITFGLFSGGEFGAPTGEAAKFTALGLEVGIEAGLYKRLPVPG